MSKQTIEFLRKFEHEPLETSHDGDTTSTAYQQLERAYTNLQDSYGQAIKDRDFWHSRYAHETNEVQRFKDKAAAMGLNTDLSRKMQSINSFEELVTVNDGEVTECIKELEDDNFELRKLLAKAEAQRDEYLGESLDYHIKGSRMYDECNELTARINELEAENDLLSQINSETQNKCNELSNFVGEVRSERDKLHSENIVYQRDNNRLIQERDEVLNDSETYWERYQDIKNELDERAEELKRAYAMADKYAHDLDECEGFKTDIAIAKKTLRDYEQELSEQIDSVNYLLDEIENYKEANAELYSDLKEALAAHDEYKLKVAYLELGLDRAYDSILSLMK